MLPKDLKELQPSTESIRQALKPTMLGLPKTKSVFGEKMI